MFREFYDDPFFGFNEYDHRNGLIRDIEKNNRVRHHQSIEPPSSSHDMAHANQFLTSGPMSLFSSRDPFSMFDSVMMGTGNFRNGIESFSSSRTQNGFGFSSMKVSSYVNDGSGQPQVFEAVHSTKLAPGGLKETKKALRDTSVGIEKMSLGRHIKDRGHVITRERNTKSGHMNENQDYIGFAEEEANNFDEEWVREYNKYSGKGNKYLKNSRFALK